MEPDDLIALTNRRSAIEISTTVIGKRDCDMVNGGGELNWINSTGISLDFLSKLGFELNCDETCHPGTSRLIQGTLPQQDVGQIATFVLDPSLKSGDELGLIDQPTLKCEQTKEKVAGFICSACHGEKSRAKARRRKEILQKRK
jgi:hypothetical protein